MDDAAADDGSAPRRLTYLLTYLALISAVPAEGDLVEHAGAELLRRAGHRLAAERAIKLDGGLVFRQRPHDQRFQSALRQVAPCGGKEPPAKAQPLEFRPQIELVDLAVIIEAARPIAPVIGVARYLVAELQEGDAAAFADRPFPPGGAAAVDQLVELGARNDPLIGGPPGLIVRVGDRTGISRSGATDFDEDSAHGTIEPGAIKPGAIKPSDSTAFKGRDSP